jgi:hypothetical protein
MLTRREGRAVLMLSLSRLEVGRRLFMASVTFCKPCPGAPISNLTMGSFLTMNRIRIPGAELGIHQLSHGGVLDASQEVILLQPS